MKANKLLLAMSVALLSGAAHAQETIPMTTLQPAQRATHSGAWEIGIGGGIVNWNRISFSGFKANTDSYFHNFKVDQVMPDAHLYIARELCPWAYADVQANLAFAPNDLAAKDAKLADRYHYLAMAGLGLQLRFTPLLGTKFVEPYLRVGVNYLYKNFLTAYHCKFEGDTTGKAEWTSRDQYNSKGAQTDKTRFVPLSFGAGLNAWFSNHVGLGLQGEYLMPIQKGLPRFFAGTARVMVRLGGEDKQPAPVVREVQVPVEKIVEKVVEKEVPAQTATNAKVSDLCRLLDNVHFDFNKDEITAESNKTLDEIATILMENQDTRWLVTGYTDARGSWKYNIELSRRRAKQVYDALLQRGVPAHMLKWRGVGKGAVSMPASQSDVIRKGDRKVLLERVSNMDFWNALP